VYRDDTTAGDDPSLGVTFEYDRKPYEQVFTDQEKPVPGEPASRTYTAIAVGLGQIFAFDSGGRVYATGANGEGQLGLGDWTDRNTFTEVTGLNGKGITAITAGWDYTFAIGSGGKVYATGDNYEGWLGLGDSTDRYGFTEVTSLNSKGITAITAACGNTVALGRGGKVYAVGWNGIGMLGLGDWENKNVFTEVTGLNGKGITAISAASIFSFAFGSGGKVYSTGYNTEGQLGLGDTANRKAFTEVTGLNDKGITAIAAKGTAFALGSGGKVYVTGRNRYGELGLGLGDNEYRAVFTLVP
jgi:alpha-tubulin suppressor-like RCC1 family protein